MTDEPPADAAMNEAELTRKRWDERASKPYVPILAFASRADPKQRADVRQAHALEYLAFQAGEINEKLGRILAALEGKV